MVFEVTPIYALPVAAITIVLWFRVSSLRAALLAATGAEAEAAAAYRTAIALAPTPAEALFLARRLASLKPSCAAPETRPFSP